MILDHLTHSDRYASLHPLFADAFRHLAELSSRAELPPGRMDLGKGDRLYAMVVDATGRDPAVAKLEAHRDYIDIQFTLSGADRIGWSTLADAGTGEGFDAEKDCELFATPPTTWVDVPEGHFAIFFPADAHAPLANGGQPVRKIVVKVKV